MMFVFSSKITFFCLFIAQLALVFLFCRDWCINLAPETGDDAVYALFGANRIDVIQYFIVYTYPSIASTFVQTGNVWRHELVRAQFTKRDLSGFGNMLFMALIGIVLASLVNFWLKSEALMWAVTYIGVVVFVGLTAYDTQKLKNIGEQIDTRDSANLRKYSDSRRVAVPDFINLFLMLLRILVIAAIIAIFKNPALRRDFLGLYLGETA